MATVRGEPQVRVLLDQAALGESLRREALEGLTSVPKELSPKWFYDDRGSALFEEITRLPEYYPTRRERQILEVRAKEIADLTGAETVIELGSGSSEKTRILLDAFSAAGSLRRFVPFDVSEAAVRVSVPALAAEYPDVDIQGVVGDFDHHLDSLPSGGTRLIVFLGGTIGNYPPGPRRLLMQNLSECLEPGDALLLGTDLMKDVARLEAAYDDSAGVTADFNRNVLLVLNRELGADFRPDRFDHVARVDCEREWVEMRLRATAAHQVTLGVLGTGIEFVEGEEMLTEISAKFRRPVVEAELGACGLALRRWWTDEFGDFALSLSCPA